MPRMKQGSIAEQNTQVLSSILQANGTATAPGIPKSSDPPKKKRGRPRLVPGAACLPYAGYKIEKGVPIPVGRGGRSPLADTIRSLEVGDSFLVTGTDEELRKKQAMCYFCVSKLKIKLTSRKTSEGLRVWRIK